MISRKTRIRHHRILIAPRLEHASWRDFLGGILEAFRTFPHWSLRIIEPTGLAQVLGEAGADGIIVGDVDEATAELLVRSEVPTVVVGSQSTSISNRRHNIAFVHNDDEAIGREGAKVAETLGTRSSFGFVPHPDRTHWSDLRARGFVSELKAHGRTVSVFRPPHLPDPRDENARLLGWLQALPKPAAVMAAYDAAAVRTLEVCKAADIEVPVQIAVFGVDNDRLLCESTRPSLSSIAPDHAYEGILAAEALAGLLGRDHGHAKKVLCTRRKFVMRESTQATKPAAILMQRALEFIEKNAATRITSADVARHLGVSHQLVELRFREFGEMSLAATIRDVRLREVRRQLRMTRQSIRTIAANCGWANVNHLGNAFKRRFGVSMTSIRENRPKA